MGFGVFNGAQDINSSWFDNVKNIGLSAGASAPEVLVQDVIAKIKEISTNDVVVKDMDGIIENVFFALPRKVRK